jgi:RimJ/RimL family protein N-acetyltransferase
LRKSLERNGEFLDQALYAMLDSDWRGSRSSLMVVKPLQMH